MAILLLILLRYIVEIPKAFLIGAMDSSVLGDVSSVLLDDIVA